MKTPLPQRSEKEAIAETSVDVPPVVVPVVTPIPKEKKSVSAEPSPWKGKKKESSLEYEELAETSKKVGSSSEGTGSK